MPLSDDQRAMLRLLAQREQGYEDIAALMGLSVDDVRAKVRDALAQLEEEGVEAPPVPDGPEPKPAVPEPPVVEPPPLTPPPTASPASAPTPKKPPGPRDNGKLIAIGGGVAGLVVIVVLAVLLISNSGGDGGDSTTTSATTSPTEQTTSGGEAEPTLAVLKPVDGSGASGTGLFANFEETLVLAIEAKGLEPTAKGTRYTIWIAASEDKMLPIASTAVGAKGTIEASVKLPAELLLFLANETYKEIAVTRTDTARLAAEGDKSKAPTYTGDAVLRGTITGPLVGADELLQKAEEEAAVEAE
jgi:hypothetical protein